MHQAETFCLNAHGVAKYLLSRAVRDAGYKVVITGEGSDEILGGYPHFRRDMLLYNREGQDPTALAAMLQQLEALNPVSRGLLLPHGDEQTARPRQAPARLRAVVDGDVLRARGKDGRPVLDGLCAAFWIARELRRAPERARRARAARRPGSSAPVAVSLVQDAPARLHSHNTRRFDGTRDARPLSVAFRGIEWKTE